MVRWQLDGEADEAEGCRGADWLGNIDLGGGVGVEKAAERGTEEEGSTW